MYAAHFILHADFWTWFERFSEKHADFDPSAQGLAELKHHWERCKKLKLTNMDRNMVAFIERFGGIPK